MDLKRLKQVYEDARIDHFEGIEIVSVNKKHLDWFIEQTEKIERYEKALEYISTFNSQESVAKHLQVVAKNTLG